MRVALLHHLSIPRGSTRLCQQLAAGLRRAGVEAHIWALRDPGDLGDLQQVPQRSYAGTAVRGDSPRDTIEINARRLAEGVLGAMVDPPDVIHVHDLTDHIAVERIRDRFPHIRVVRTVHHLPGAADCWLRLTDRRLVGRADAVIAVSLHGRQQVSEEYGQHATIIHNGVDLDGWKRPARFDGVPVRSALGLTADFLFLAVGGVAPRKGTIALFRALDRLRGKIGGRVALAVVGGGSPSSYTSYREELAAVLRRSPLRAGVDYAFTGALSDQELARLYWASDAFVMPSMVEGWGIAAVEAMASALPTVLSDLEVFREFAPRDDDAAYFPPGDVPGLATQMRHVVRDDELRKHLAEGGPALAAPYTWASCVDRHLAVYTAVVR